MRGSHRRAQPPVSAGWRARTLVASLVTGAVAAGSGVIAMTTSAFDSSGPARLSSAVTPPPTCGDAAALTLRAALAQTLMIGISGPSRAELSGLAKVGIGGLFLHGDGTRELTDGRLKRLAKATVPVLVSADDEGGRVQRISPPAGSMRSARKQAQTLSPDEVRRLGRQRGRQLAAYGITMNLAPVVDLGSSNPAIGDRSYGRKPDSVARYAGAFAAGLREAGVLPALKHFPGHGRAAGDSHRGPAVTPPVAALRDQDWEPYRRLGATGVAVMVGHLTVPGLSTKGLPSSLDPAIYRALRTEVGFGGLVVTDELSEMKAVRDRFGLHEAVRRALAAGADLALFFAEPNRMPRLIRALEADVNTGRLPEARVREAASRVLGVKTCGG